MDIKLTQGAVCKLMQGIEVESPVLQILGYKKIAGQAGSDRFRLNISDGVHSHSFAMLATQLNSMIPDKKLDNFSVIRADKLISNAVAEKRVLIILELTLLAKGDQVGKVIGAPTQWKEGMSTGGPTNNNHTPAPVNGHAKAPTPVKPEPGTGAAASSFYGRPAPAAPAPTNNAPSRVSSSSMSDYADISNIPHMPIADITPYNNKCPIRARVTNKSDIKTWSNSRGEGKLFNVELLDDSGEIRMTGFNTAVDQFYDVIEEQQVYIIRHFTVKAANKQYSSLSHDYELSFTNDTQFFPFLGDSAEIPTLTYNFVDIANIEGVEANATIDVIGVVKRRGELQTLTQRTTGKELKKRDLFIVDRTNREINLTLWGKQAEDFNDDSQPVIAAKGVKVSDFSGKSLSALSSSSIQLNPDIRESHILRGWFDNEGVNAESSSLSIQVGGRGGSAGTPWKLLREANWNEQTDPEKGDFFMSKVTVMSIKRENSAYQACPTPTCNKKVINLDNGLFRCEKCNREFPDFKWRLMVSVNFADYSDHLWATCFQEASEALLGQPASILGPMSKDSAEEFDAVVKDCVFNSYIVKFRSKMDTFNNETRMRVTVMDLHKLNFTEYSAKLIAEIKETA